MRVTRLLRAAPLIGALVVVGCSASQASSPPSPTKAPPAAAAPAPAASQPQTNPWPGTNFDIAFYVETVTASPNESVYGKWAPLACSQTNFFARGERVVWHVAAVDAHKGAVIEPNAVESAVLKVPGTKDIDVTYIPHGKGPTAPWTWDAKWDVPPDYPIGVVPFQVQFRLKGWPAGKVAVFTQIPIALEQLTIVDHR